MDAVEYRDFPCAPGMGDKVVIHDDAPSALAQAEALRQLDEESRAMDVRMNARARAAQQAREAEARERMIADQLASASTQADATPILYLPVGADSCAARPALCSQRFHKPRKPSAKPPLMPVILQKQAGKSFR